MQSKFSPNNYICYYRVQKVLFIFFLCYSDCLSKKVEKLKPLKFTIEQIAIRSWTFFMRPYQTRLVTFPYAIEKLVEEIHAFHIILIMWLTMSMRFIKCAYLLFRWKRRKIFLLLEMMMTMPMWSRNNSPESSCTFLTRNFPGNAKRRRSFKLRRKYAFISLSWWDWISVKMPRKMPSLAPSVGLSWSSSPKINSD